MPTEAGEDSPAAADANVAMTNEIATTNAMVTHKDARPPPKPPDFADDATVPGMNYEATTATTNDGATTPATKCDALAAGNAAMHNTADALTKDANMIQKAADVMANDDTLNDNNEKILLTSCVFKHFHT
mmetsp:Transcript_62637/g.74168  ORF Transcript_62637/g.74168 Transcript_62637/m.74168 type:complete len:130 (-) Transcript_62637:11-400(-)